MDNITDTGKTPIVFKPLYEKQTVHGSVFTVELPGIEVPSALTGELHSYRREIEQIFKNLLFTLNIPVTRFRYLGRVKIGLNEFKDRIISKETNLKYTVRIPMWVKDEIDGRVKAICFLPQGGYSEHRYIGAIYGYPRCCIDSYVLRQKYFKNNDEEKLRMDGNLRNHQQKNLIRWLPYGFEPCARCIGNEKILAPLIKQHALIDDTDLNPDAVWMAAVTRYITGQLKVWNYQHKKLIETT